MMQSWHWGAPRVTLLTLLGLTSALAALLSLLGTSTSEPTAVAFFAGRFPWFSACLTATFCSHLITLKGDYRPWLMALGFLELPNVLWGASVPFPYPPFGVALAAGALLIRGVLLARTQGDERKEHLAACFDSLVPPWFCLVSLELLEWTSALTPYVRDLEIQSVGGLFGPWPPLLVARLFSALPALHALCATVYGAMPLGLAIVHAFAFRAQPSRRPSLLLSFVWIPLLGYPLYFALPMVGPREAWACLLPPVAFPPAEPPGFGTTLLTPGALVPRNCMPSLHTAWTLAAVLEARRISRPLLAFAIGWFACTELATLGLGEHWLVDLVVAVPFTLAVYALADGRLASREGRVRFAALAALVLGWIGVLALCTESVNRHPWGVMIAMLLTPPIAVALNAVKAAAE